MASRSVQVDGLRELDAALNSLGADVANRIARAATAAGASVIRKEAVRQVPVKTGNLKKNIIIKRLRPSETDVTSEHIVTVRQGKLTKKQKAAGLGDAFYGRFVELGTVKMPAQPFLRPAIETQQAQAIEAVKARIVARLKKAGAR